MIKNKKTAVKFLFLIIFLIITFYLIYIKNQCKSRIFYFLNNLQGKYLDCINFTGIKEYKLKDIYREQKNLFSGLYEKGNNFLRVEIWSDINQDVSDKTIDSKITTINSQFENNRSPYPGEISDEIKCDDRFKPEFKKGFIIAYLNNRLTYGSCSEEENLYKSILTWTFCGSQRKLYQMEFIYPKDKFHEERLEISCLY